MKPRDIAQAVGATVSDNVQEALKQGAGATVTDERTYDHLNLRVKTVVVVEEIYR